MLKMLEMVVHKWINYILTHNYFTILELKQI